MKKKKVGEKRNYDKSEKKGKKVGKVGKQRCRWEEKMERKMKRGGKL